MAESFCIAWSFEFPLEEKLCRMLLRMLLYFCCCCSGGCCFAEGGSSCGWDLFVLLGFILGVSGFARFESTASGLVCPFVIFQTDWSHFHFHSRKALPKERNLWILTRFIQKCSRNQLRMKFCSLWADDHVLICTYQLELVNLVGSDGRGSQWGVMRVYYCHSWPIWGLIICDWLTLTRLWLLSFLSCLFRFFWRVIVEVFLCNLVDIFCFDCELHHCLWDVDVLFLKVMDFSNSLESGLG